MVFGLMESGVCFFHVRGVRWHTRLNGGCEEDGRRREMKSMCDAAHAMELRNFVCYACIGAHIYYCL